MNKIFVRVGDPDKEPSQEDPKPKPKKKVLVKVKKPDLTNIDNELTENLTKHKNEVVEFYNNYLSSPKYKQRLIKQGYEDPEKAIDLRKSNIQAVDVKKEWGRGGEYDTVEQKVYADPWQFARNPDYSIPGFFGHEYSHVAGAINPLNPNYKYPQRVSEREYGEFEKRNKLFKMKNVPADMAEVISHDKQGNESKADMDALRYMLYKDNLYNAGTQDFTKDLLMKAKEKYSGDFNAARFFRNFSDDDIIWLMNNIAKNDSRSKVKVRVPNDNSSIA